MSRGWVKEVRLDDTGNIQSINDFMGGFTAPGDMEFGPDGSMYVLEYGTGFFSGSPETKLVRIDYVKNGRVPVVKASADTTEGPAPLSVNFSSEGTNDADGGTLTYKWEFGDGGTSSQENPSYTYQQNGDYQAKLTVTDSTDKSASATVNISVGNTTPKVDLQLPIDGGLFDFGDEIRFKVNVTDTEDGTVDCQKVTVSEGVGHDAHAHPGLNQNSCEGVIQTGASSDHGPEANIYGVISASYTDQGANDGANAPLTGRDQAILQPKLRQAEHFSSRQGVGVTGYDDKSGTKPGGGGLVTGMGNGDWIAYDPMSLSRIESVDLTYSGNPGSGAKIELHAGAPTGPIVASVNLAGNSGGLYFYKTVSGQITSREADAAGRPLYFVYSGAGGINFDEVLFHGTGAAVNVAPTITSIKATPDDGPAPLEVAFSATADDPDGEDITYSWDFGVEGIEDDTSTEQNPSYTYTEPGTYNAKVTATDSTDKSSDKTVQVIVRRPCATAPTPDEGYTLLFNGKDLTGWKQAGPGGFTIEGCEMTSFGGLGMLWYSEKQFEDYSLKLQFKLSDDGDNSGVFQRFPDPRNDPFVAVNKGHEVQIKEGPENDEPQKTGSIYNFDREDARNARPIGEWNDYEIRVVGQTYTVFLNGEKVNEYTSDGSRGVQGFVGLQNHGTNDKVSFRTVQVKELEIEEPFINTLSVNKVRGAAPLTVDYTADAVDRQDDAITYEWDFGVPGTDADKATGKNVSYTYEEGGTYTASVTPVDAKGNRGAARETRPVTAEVAPVATATADPSCGIAPLAVQFAGSAEDPQGQDVTYNWDFGVDGTDTDTSTQQNPTYTYEEVGKYTATLVVTDPDGNEGEMTVPIVVRAEGECLAAADLSTFFNNDGISTHENLGDGNFDDSGWSYAAETLPDAVLPDGGPVTLSGVTYRFPSPADGLKNTVEANGQTIPMPSGKYGRLMILAAAHHGDVQTTATVTYADGSTSQVPLKVTDWAKPPVFGEKIEVNMPHRHDANGDTSPPVYIFSQAVPLDSAKGLKSIELPVEDKLHLFAMTATGSDIEPPPPPPPSRDCERSDDFEGTTLNKDRWNRIAREDDSLYELSGGNLNIQTGAGELQSGAPNLIMQNAPTNAFTATTKLTIPTTTAGQQGGIVLANPADNDYLKLAFVRKSDSGDKWVEFLRMNNGQNDFSGNWHSGPGGDFGGPFLPADFGDTVYLRLSTNDGQTFKGEFSKDGENWESAGDDRQGFGEGQSMGVYALRGAADRPVATASFASFDITPDKECSPDNGAPEVTASAEPTSGVAPLDVAFTADATDPDGDDLTYEWDFGVEGTDADTSTQQNPTYTYEKAGTYTATVTVTDTGGAKTTKTVEVTVSKPAAQKHVIDAIDENGPSRWVPSEIFVKPGDTVRWEFDQAKVSHTLTSSSSNWQMDEYRDPDGPAVEYTFTEPGEYTFLCQLHAGMTGKVTVVEDGGGENKAPTAEASAQPTSGIVPLNVSFVGGGTDPDGDAITYSWDFGVEGTDADQANTKDASYTYEEAGTSTATLMVTDSKGAEAKDTVQIKVDPASENQAPTAEASADPDTGKAPLEVKFAAGASDPDGRSVTRGPFKAFADGPALGYSNVSGAGELTRMRNATEAMLDVSGLKPNANYDVHVHAQPCSVNNGGPHYTHDHSKPATSDNEIWLPFTSDAEGRGQATANRPWRAGPEAVSVVIHDKAAQGKRVVCADLKLAEDDLSFEWDFGDGQTSTQRNPTHTYEKAGTYTATLTVTDSEGAEAKDTVQVKVIDPDTTAPQVNAQLDPPEPDGNNGWYTQPVTATITANDGENGSGVESIEYRLDDGAWTTYDSPITINGEGGHVLRYRATDKEGNTSEVKTVSIKIDTKTPVTTAELDPPEPNGDPTPGYEGTYNTPVEVTLTAKDATSGVAGTQYRLDDGEWSVYTEPIKVSEEGKHVVAYRSVDKAGNVEEAGTVSFEIKNDACPGSDLRNKVWVGEQRTNVDNVDTGDGCTINDLIKEEKDWKNHGQFMGHVNKITKQLVANDIITKKEREEILEAAGKSDVGKKEKGKDKKNESKG